MHFAALQIKKQEPKGSHVLSIFYDINYYDFSLKIYIP